MSIEAVLSQHSEEDSTIIGYGTTNLTPLPHGKRYVKRSVAKGVLGFTGCLLLLGVPGIPSDVKASLIGGFGLSLGASCTASALARPGEKNHAAKFFRGFADKCLSLAAMDAFSEYGTEAFKQISPGMNNNLATGLGKISGRMMADSVLNSKAYGEYHFGSNLAAAKDIRIVLVNAALKGFLSPFILAMILPGGQFGVATFVTYVVGRSIVDMVLNGKINSNNFFSGGTMKEGAYLLMYYSLSFASMGLFSAFVMPELDHLVPELTSTSLAKGAVNAAYSVATEQFIIEPLAKVIARKHEPAHNPHLGAESKAGKEIKPREEEPAAREHWHDSVPKPPSSKAGAKPGASDHASKVTISKSLPGLQHPLD